MVADKNHLEKCLKESRNTGIENIILGVYFGTLTIIMYIMSNDCLILVIGMPFFVVFLSFGLRIVYLSRDEGRIIRYFWKKFWKSVFLRPKVDHIMYTYKKDPFEFLRDLGYDLSKMSPRDVAYVLYRNYEEYKKDNEKVVEILFNFSIVLPFVKVLIPREIFEKYSFLLNKTYDIEEIGDGSLRVVSGDGQSFLVPKQEKEVVLFLKRLSRIF